uniref:Uncharacterized protein n=1 Tax=Anguilla anguilla TaxID=7936 RepID=A0A0E9X448_ANGAN
MFSLTLPTAPYLSTFFCNKSDRNAIHSETSETFLAALVGVERTTFLNWLLWMQVHTHMCTHTYAHHTNTHTILIRGNIQSLSHPMHSTQPNSMSIFPQIQGHQLPSI